LNRKALFIFIPLIAILIVLFLRFQNSTENKSQKWFEKIDAAVSPERIQQNGKLFWSSPHRAGTDANRKAGDQIIKLLSEAGLKTTSEEYTFDFPEPVDAQLVLIEPEQIKLDLYEKKLADDPWSEAATRELPFLAFSPDADIEAKLIYANSGSKEDYGYLSSQGIQIAGTIALVRARGICRSMKIHAAEKEGVAGLLIYPELKDQGFLKPEFPYGPHLNPWTAQRGTLLKYFLYPGDPSDPESQAISTLPKIPALAISQQTAAVLLSHLQGDEVPADWVGWLPQGYRTGPGPASVRLIYQGKNERRTIRNITAFLEGIDNQVIIAGNHYDAWVYGAADPSSGTSVMLETAKVLADLVRNGWKPQRKILFAFWDGEEYGMFGSTKWVQKNLSELKRSVAYINVDTAFRARDLAAYVSPGLYTSFDQALEGLNDPDSGKLFSETRPEFQNPGFSGDTAPFVRLAGIPVVDASFGRTYSVYHSVYDNELWMEKFGDPRAGYRAALAKIVSRYLFLLSNEKLIPYDFTEIQPYSIKALNELKQSWPNDRKQWDATMEPLNVEIQRFHSVALELASKKVPDNKRSEFNQLLITAMQSFYDHSQGSGLLMEASKKLGCAGEAMPFVAEAARTGDDVQLKQQIQLLISRFKEAGKYLEKAKSLEEK
jgi:N-acetylated-alpha-linked acidic dipeptidase